MKKVIKASKKTVKATILRDYDEVRMDEIISFLGAEETVWELVRFLPDDTVKDFMDSVERDYDL